MKDFLQWLKDNKFCQYKDGTWYSLNERPYIKGVTRKYYEDDELISLYEKSKI